MVVRFFRGGGRDRLEHAQSQLLQMLADDRHSFDVATAALLTGADPEVAGRDLMETDQRVNEAERDIRRQLVVHASVRGTAEVPAMLVYMSVVKDVERIGDYAKNIYDLAAQGVSFADAPDRDELLADRDRISAMISEAGRIFADEDVEAANAMIAEGDKMLDVFDDRVEALIVSDGPAREAVPRALLSRHFKRIVAHLMNLLSAIVVPVDRIDYFDEPRRPRRDRV